MQSLAILNGNGPLTTTRQVKHNALLGFYRYAISRGFVREIGQIPFLSALDSSNYAK
jgi:hypothetical protein